MYTFSLEKYSISEATHAFLVLDYNYANMSNWEVYMEHFLKGTFNKVVWRNKAASLPKSMQERQVKK